jgi:wyosine [tRNA(Phe)-imidazoG37] synthetase (radical SAM superfamily)
METKKPRGGPKAFETAFGRPRNFLGNRFVYAVISQRARGLSIGINFNPDKRCNFDCVYCEVHRTGREVPQQLDTSIMAQELENLLTRVFAKRLTELPGFRGLPPELLELKEVALSGDGEPTLCPNFPDILSDVVHLRSRGIVPFFKLVLITNTAGLSRLEVQRSLQLLTRKDEIWVKLEAGTQEYMDRVNRPDISLQQVVANILLIARSRPVVIQSLFPLIDGQEPGSAEIAQYVLRLKELVNQSAQISMVQVYSAHRPPDRTSCGHLPLKSLSEIARQVREGTGLKAEVF